MRLTAPKQITLWIAALLALLGLLGTVASLSFITTYAFWFLFVGFIVLALGVLISNF